MAKTTKRAKTPAKPARKTAPKPAAKTGRPTDYRPALCARVVDMGRQGMGRAEIAAALDIVRQTLADWEKRHPAFLDAMTRAHDLSLAWWMEQGRKGIWAGKSFNARAYELQARNRFGDDFTRPSSTVDLNLDEVRDALHGKLARLAAGASAARVPGKPQR